MVEEDNIPLGDATEAKQVVVKHHPPPPRPRLRRKMRPRKSTKPIVEEFEMIDIATSTTRPSLSNVEPIMLKAYHRMSYNDWADHHDVSITQFTFNFVICRELIEFVLFLGR